MKIKIWQSARFQKFGSDLKGDENFSDEIFSGQKYLLKSFEGT